MVGLHARNELTAVVLIRNTLDVQLGQLFEVLRLYIWFNYAARTRLQLLPVVPASTRILSSKDCFCATDQRNTTRTAMHTTAKITASMSFRIVDQALTQQYTQARALPSARRWSS